MEYRAKRTLNSIRGVIKSGQKVPFDYERFEEAKVKGWIELVPKQDIPIHPSSVEEVKEEIETEIKEDIESEIKEDIESELESKSDVQEPPVTESNDPSTLFDRSIGTHCSFLSEDVIDELAKNNIRTMDDLKNVPVDSLIKVKYIGIYKAEKILKCYEDYKEDHGT